MCLPNIMKNGLNANTLRADITGNMFGPAQGQLAGDPKLRYAVIAEQRRREAAGQSKGPNTDPSIGAFGLQQLSRYGADSLKNLSSTLGAKVGPSRPMLPAWLGGAQASINDKAAGGPTQAQANEADDKATQAELRARGKLPGGRGY